MKKRGHNILVTAVNKEITHQLLDIYGIRYVNLGSHSTSLFKKVLNLLQHDLKLILLSKKFNPDIFLGLSSIRASHAAFFLKKKSFIFDDTEHSKNEIRLYLPFVTNVLTPSCFTRNLGKKQIRYSGYHELAYLHPNRFRPDPSVLDELGLKKGEKYVIIRFVKWGASHDRGERGFSNRDKIEIVKEVKKHARPIITSEGALPSDLLQYQIKIAPHRIHHALYYSQMYIGEGATMASEAAILGVPSIYINSLELGYVTEQEKNYGVSFNFRNSVGVIDTVKELLKNKNIKEEWVYKRKKMLEDKIDVTQFMIDFVEDHYDKPK